MDNQLFVDRTAEAAARQLALTLAWATECQLATVEELEHRSRTSRYELKRHRSIAATLVYHCKDLNVEPRGFMGRPCTRLRDELAKSIEELHVAVQMADMAILKRLGLAHPPTPAKDS